VIVDASAVLAILFDEPESEAMEDVLLSTSVRAAMAPMNYLEAAVRVDRLGSSEKSERFDQLVRMLDIEIARTGSEHVLLAREAYRKFGKGNHPAKLNLGDCFAYALAKARREPLLFKGNDFSQTDVEAAL
jgi:ribonuclease VapC